VPGDRCLLEGFRKLPAAHALLFDVPSGTSRRWRYWQPPAIQSGSAGPDERELIDELDTLLAAAVNRQLVADVPVGVLLSGGVDSSLVTAMAARARSRVQTFTVRFPGFDDYDESGHARLIARHFGTDHVELDVGETSVDVLPVLARQYDEPIIDSSMIPTHQLSAVIRRHCTVALGGDGGDELFGGYSHYSRLLWLQERLGWVPTSVRRAASRVSPLLPLGFKGRNWLGAVGADFGAG
jgi:asparagine synthase (glutamine-hydrolysing)